MDDTLHPLVYHIRTEQGAEGVLVISHNNGSVIFLS